ncbi:TraX family protein [Massilia sp. CCM 9210]|uniref:TraX family protein n=1 Tax=Massilia scottii TaxID=3057166 RepID=UPI002796E23D|nr:TraX family protein [Massilia sp. CCM 9210]MDQ1817805.1 TraX family protein [Massilia sp. CCM 9210]
MSIDGSEISNGHRDKKTAALPVIIPDGAIEVLKWLGLVLMTGDHINKYLLSEAQPWLFAFGRLTLPIFCFVLAYNLARPGILESGVYRRLLRRLGFFAILATVPYIALGNLTPGAILFGWWPLNILATLAIAVLCIFFLHRNHSIDKILFTIVFLIGGAVVEFWWLAITSCIGAWLYCRSSSLTGLFLWVGSTLLLGLINNNWWAIIALPIIFMARYITVPVPRAKWIFYIYYPGHLMIIWALIKFH